MPIRVAASLLIALAVLALIFVLARQSTKGTQDLAWHTERMLMRIVPPTGTGSIGEPTWFGLTIRRLAHIGEYALLGLAVSWVFLGLGSIGRQLAVTAALTCLIASLADELHKIVVPGRHFDPADLALDAVGYLPVVLVVAALSA